MYSYDPDVKGGLGLNGGDYDSALDGNNNNNGNNNGAFSPDGVRGNGGGKGTGE